MESKGIDPSVTKRKRTMLEVKEANMAEIEDEEENQGVVEEDAEINAAGSEEMEMNIANVLQRIELFTQQVSELLEAGKATLRDLSADFEERMISIHREQIEKWQDQIKELRSVDALNEQASNRLRNAQYLLQNVQVEDES